MSPVAASPVATTAAAQTIIDDRNGGISASVNRLVGGIISFVRWPATGNTRAMTGCTVGQPVLTSSVRPLVPGGSPLFGHSNASVDAIIGGQPCDVIYMGRLALAERRRLIDWIRGRPILTITDNDPECLSGAAFCLVQRAGGLSFLLNIDAISRSKLAVDPRVLELGRNRRVGA